MTYPLVNVPLFPDEAEALLAYLDAHVGLSPHLEDVKRTVRGVLAFEAKRASS